MSNVYTVRFASRLVLPILVCVAGLASAESWTVMPPPTTSRLTNVVMASTKYGYVAGADGTLLRTTDGAATWRQQRFTTAFTHSFYCVSAPDTNNFAMAVGDDGEVIQLLPKAPSWNNLVQTTDTVFGVCFRPDTVATFMSVGRHGFIGQYQAHSHTYTLYDDYGYPRGDTTEYFVDIVTLQPPLTGASLRAIAFNVSKGYVVGDSGVILTTVNAGTTWAKRTVGANVSLRALSIISPTKILAVGQAGAMWMTTNAGTDWRNVAPAGLKTNLRSVSFADATHGVIVGDNALILQTSDGGATWVRVGVNVFTTLRGVFCVQSSDGSFWIAVGDSGTVVTTRYGGSQVTYATDKNAVTMGDVQVGAKKSDLITYTNLSTEGYVGVRLVSPDPRVTLSPDRLMLGSSEAGKIKVTFAPTDTSRIDLALVVFQDTSFNPDTIHVSGHGIAAIASYPTDTVYFDSALAGRTGTAIARSVGNITLTARVLSVSDTNFLVVCDSAAKPGDSLRITVTLKHTLAADAKPFCVLQTNTYQHPRDTIFIVAYHVDFTAVREGASPSTIGGSVFPNPVVAGGHGILNIAKPAFGTYVIRIADERGVVVSEQHIPNLWGTPNLEWTLPSLPRGRFFLELAAPTGALTGGKFVVE